jgi:hypothetical protein
VRIIATSADGKNGQTWSDTAKVLAIGSETSGIVKEMSKLMNHRSRLEDATTPTTGERFAANSLHPAWRALVRYCGDLRHGEIEQLKIQDGLPVLAEVTRKKIRFHREQT